MKLSYKWLKEYVNTKFPAEVIAEKLTMSGLEVDEIVSGHNFSGVVVGKVVSLEKHPNADKLRVAQVDVGSEILQIVCGAANLEKEQTVAVAIVGAKLGDFEIGKASLRGVDSFGMICSEQELGLGADHSGIMILDKATKIGEVFVSEKGADQVLDVKVLANRPDCMSVVGLAREVAALTGERLVLPRVSLVESKPSTKVNITLEDAALCPRYMARVVTEVKRTETPQWMKERLLASGVRSIDLFVDISNYVMLEYGQPLHFFDLDKVSSKGTVKIGVRLAKSGEQLTTLDGNKRKLTTEMLVITDGKDPIALAGVMGGATTEIDKNTQNIFIEAAVFDKASIRRTSRALGLRSEAVARYEKGIGIASPEAAIARAAQLLADIAGGLVEGKATDTLKTTVKNRKISLNPSKLNAFLGSSYTDRQIQSVLTKLGFTVTVRTKYLYEIVVPTWRVDIDEPVDLYEEVSRVIGFDSIPSTLPYSVRSVSKKNEGYEFAKKVRHGLAGIGITEIMTYSFAGETELRAVSADTKDAFELANPLVKEQKYMRTSLVPKMLEALAANQYHRESIRFFEIGKSFHRKGRGLPQERNWLSVGVVGGKSWPITYVEGAEYYDTKGIVENFFYTLGISDLLFQTAENTVFQTGRAADVFVGKAKVGEIGITRSELAATFGLKRESAVAELDLDSIMKLVASDVKVKEISRYQHSLRDISFVVSDKVQVSQVMASLSAVDKLAQNVEIIDIYQGKTLPADEKSITIRLTIVSDEKTLTEAEVDEVVQKAVQKLSGLGGKVRGSKA